MAVTAMQLVAKVTADTTQAEAGLTGFSRLAAGLGGAVGVGVLAAGAAIAGVGIASTKMAGDFQAGMTSLVTGAGESKGNLKLVSDGILQMAVDTGTSTKQLTDGMYMIESAGYHGKDGLDVLKAAAEGAKVGNADLGVTADAVTTIMKDYADQHVNASQATNALIATVANGKTHMQDLAGAMAEVLPTASAAGVGLKDTMAAMATMTGEGVPAANAATYLRQTLLALNAPSSQAKKAMEDVGLSTDQVSAAMKTSLPDALKMITDHISQKFKPGSAEYINALKDIFGGTRELQGALDLTGQHMGAFTDNVGKISGAVTSGGSSIQGWSDVQGNFNQKVDRAKEVVETLMIRLGTGLLPVAGKIVDAFATHLVPALKDVRDKAEAVAHGVQNLIKFFQDTGPASTAVKVVLFILTGALLGFAASAIPAAVTAIMASVTAFGAQAVAAGAAALATIAAAAPFILVGAAIAAVIAVIVLMVQHWDKVQQALGWVKDRLGDFMGVLGGVKDAIGGFIGGAIGKLGDAWNGLGTLVGNIWGGITGAVKGGINLVIDGINFLIGALDAVQIHIPAVGVGPVHTPAFDWNGLGIPKIPHLAAGGTALGAGAALVGERGPEIVSLPRGASVIPLPAGLGGSGGASAGGQGAQQTIIIQLDGRTLAHSTVKHMPTVIRLATGARAF